MASVTTRSGDDIDTPRRVVLVGIAGASGSGKSSLARRLATRLDSPFLALQMDWYFRPTLPSDAHDSWEQPSAIDHEAFLAGIDALVDVARSHSCPRVQDPAIPRSKSDDASGEPCSSLCEGCFLSTPPKPKRQGIDVHRPRASTTATYSAAAAGSEEAATPSSVAFIIVEGFLLFAFEEVAQRFDVRICVEASLEKCCLRRFLRENYVDEVAASAAASPETDHQRQDDDAREDAASARYALSNDWAVVKTKERDPAVMAQLPEYRTTYRAWFEASVVPSFRCFWPVQRSNAASGARPLLDAATREAEPAADDDDGAQPLARSADRTCWHTIVDNDVDDPGAVPAKADTLATAILAACATI